MPPSPTASPCVFAGDTLYCSAKDAFIPGPNAGIYATTIEHQVRQSIRNLLDNLEEADMDLGDVVAANVYLDDISDFQAMNKIYAKYFKAPYPARTTIQQIAPVERKADDEGGYRALEQFSLIAVRRWGVDVAGREERDWESRAAHGAAPQIARSRAGVCRRRGLRRAAASWRRFLSDRGFWALWDPHNLLGPPAPGWGCWTSGPRCGGRRRAASYRSPPR